MAEHDDNRAAQAHQILNLLQQLTELTSRPDEDGVLFRLVQSGNRDVLGNAYVSQRVMTALQTALESMLAVAQADQQMIQRMKAEADGRRSAVSCEEIPSGEWSAAAVAQNDPQLYADVTDVFDAIDPISLLDDVFRSDRPGDAADAYEEMTGEWNGEL
ncbi:hypothetical protein [Streptomyces bottropensis]|uniref:hypothetical protein n=1 Tax=Streptomyces bottropensis TaxID=42235 RepID=UPI0036B3C8D8